MNIIDTSKCENLKEEIEKLPSVRCFSFKAANGEFASITDFVCQAHLNQQQLIDRKDALYEVCEFLNRKGIHASLHANEYETFWEFIV